MLISFENFLTLFIAYLAFGIKPGPYMMAFISLAAAGHVRKLIFFWLGTAVAIVFMYSVVLYSLDFLAQHMVNASVPILLMKAIAAIIFINLGVMGFIKGESKPPKKAGQTYANKISVADRVENFGSGFLLTLSNPYHLIFVFSIIPALLNAVTFSLADIIFVNATSVLADAVIISVFCLPIVLMSKKINDQILGYIRKGANAIMILIGGYILYSIFDQWDLIQSGILQQNYFKGDNL